MSMQMPDQGPGRDASRAFASGFAGCPGVGLAIIAVLIVLIIIGVASSHH